MTSFKESPIITIIKPYLRPVKTAALNFYNTSVNRYSLLLRKIFKSNDIIHKFKLAQKWVINNSIHGKGVAVTNNTQASYPEVSGYFIPTLLNWGERELAIKYKNWLISSQNADGSWNDPSGEAPYIFDTGQILKGLMALSDYFPELKENIIKGCDWILSNQVASGRIITPNAYTAVLTGGRSVPEGINLYTLEPIRNAGIKWGIKKYTEAVEKAVNYYLADKNLTDFNTLSHFHAYIIEALADLGQTQKAKEAMENVAILQKPNGSVPAYNDVNWVCSTGLFQYAIIWYKLGITEKGDKAFEYAVKLQNKTGGFYGSYGQSAAYFQKKEISWAVKYFMDAYYWKIRSFFNAKIDIFPETIDAEDGRVKKILSFLGDMNGRKVIDVGCGKGRFLRVFKSIYPKGNFYALDISEEMLKHCPQDITKNLGSILNIPYPDSYFDYVYSVETIEHALSVENAVKELCRVLKPGGKIIIIDKDSRKLGKMKITDWEQWFSTSLIKNLLDKNGINSVYKVLSKAEYNLSDNLFVAWEGIKPQTKGI